MISLISTSIRLLTAIHFALRIPEFRNQLILVGLMLPTGVPRRLPAMDRPRAGHRPSR
jgi:hypothetical protein